MEKRNTPAEKPCREWKYIMTDVLYALSLVVMGAVIGVTMRKSEGKKPWSLQEDAAEFFMMFANADCPRIAIENPIGVMSTKFRKPDQIIQPWQFGHGETKATCLWLKGLPKLVPTEIVEGREHRIHRMPPGPERAKLRSKTFPGIARAMAEQWAGDAREASDE